MANSKTNFSLGTLAGVAVVALLTMLAGAVGYILTHYNPSVTEPYEWSKPIFDPCGQKVKFNPECARSSLVYGFEYDKDLGSCKAVNAAGGCSFETPFDTMEECRNACETLKEERTVEVGEEFLITLDANPTAGYSWEAAYDKSFIVLRSKDFVAEKVRPNVVGAGGKEVFTFAALRAGKTEITMRYGRSWESKAEKTQVFKYNITTDGEISVSTSKAAYGEGESVGVKIENSGNKTVFVDYPLVERHENGAWSELRGSIIWSGCQVPGGMPYFALEPKISSEYIWDQKEKWCASDTSDLKTYTKDAGSGKYRIKTLIIVRTKVESEDPNNVQGIPSDKYIYSNEFDIGEGEPVPDSKCDQKVEGFGLCKAYFEGYEFDGASCVKMGVSGCSFSSPFDSLEECRSECESAATDIFSCKSDSDCVSVKADCCGCTAGGAAIAINKEHKKKWLNDLGCETIFCPAVISDDPSCIGKPECVNNKCAINAGKIKPVR